VRAAPAMRCPLAHHRHTVIPSYTLIPSALHHRHTLTRSYPPPSARSPPSYPHTLIPSAAPRPHAHIPSAAPRCARPCRRALAACAPSPCTLRAPSACTLRAPSVHPPWTLREPSMGANPSIDARVTDTGPSYAHTLIPYGFPPGALAARMRLLQQRGDDVRSAAATGGAPRACDGNMRGERGADECVYYLYEASRERRYTR
jgi:hypothetical protein